MGKILVIEGTDFSGKSTQYDILLKRLYEEGFVVGSDSFPNYDSESSFFVKSYLGGLYGDDANKIDPKTASIFYTMDRYHSYMTRDWGKVYREGGDIVFARYITSNVLHQAAKYSSWEEKKAYIDWLYDMECNVMGIPREDFTIFLDMPPYKAQELKKQRLKEQNGLTSSGGVIDIHENNISHLISAYENAKQVGNYLGWKVVSCVDKNNELKPIKEISEEIYTIAKSVLGY